MIPGIDYPAHVRRVKQPKLRQDEDAELEAELDEEYTPLTGQLVFDSEEPL